MCVYLYILERCPESALHSIPDTPDTHEAVIDGDFRQMSWQNSQCNRLERLPVEVTRL